MSIKQSPRQALVTGGANGLGKGFVKALLAEGFTVHVVDRDIEGLQTLHHEQSGELMTHTLDLSNVEEVVQTAERYWKAKQFDIVVLNAGISATGKFEKIPPLAHEKLLAINTLSPMIIANILIAGQGLADRSNLLFVSSLSHATGYPGAASYAASKDALAIYAKSIRKSVAKSGVVVSCAFPGPIRTEHAERHSPVGANPDRRADPDKLAATILRASRAGRRSIYPGFGAKTARLVGSVAPGWTTKMMRKALFDKLEHEVY